MKKISIQNLVTGRSYRAIFESQTEADAWIEKQSSKESWGKNEIIDIKDEQSHENARAVFVEEVITQEVFFDENFEPVQDEDGDTVFEDSIKYKFRIPQEYIVTVEDFVDFSSAKKQVEDTLDATDWLFVSDVSMPTSYRQAYIEYRQILRDLHNRITDGLASDSDASVESFENFMQRTRSNEFLDGGNGLDMIKKFNAKL